MNSRRINKNIIISLIVILFIGSCDDIFVQDISDQELQLQAPTNGFKTTDPLVKFRWDPITNATAYKLEVVSPSFEGIYEMIVDTIIEINDTLTINSINKLEEEFDIGEYEWRVQALNSISYTDFCNSSFTILPSYDISKRKISLLTPENQLTSSEPNMHFSWDTISKAHQYNFIIRSNSWNGDSIWQTILYTNESDFNLNDGIYFWGVSAEDTVNNKETDFSVNKLTIDTKAPSIPELVTPEQFDTIYSKNVLFKWNATEANASYNFEVYEDANLSKSIITKELSDTTSFIDLERTGIFYWRVNSVDSLGNTSLYSSPSAFYLSLPKDISTQQTELLSPSNGTVSISKDISFWWSKLEGAESYTFELVSPSFSGNNQLVYLSEQDSNSIKLSLNAGEYEWRVKALNSDYSTSYSYSSFSIYKSAVEDQQVYLVYPSYNSYQNTSDIEFEWKSLGENIQYQIIIKEEVWEEGTEIINDLTSTNKAGYSLADGTYYWGVKAIDTYDNSYTEFTTRKLNVDTQKPESPLLTEPENNYTSENTLVSFQWESSSDTDDLSYQIYIYKLSGTEYSEYLVKTSSLTSMVYNLDDAGQYYWYVEAKDQAGNISDKSEIHYLKITEEADLSSKTVTLLAPSNYLNTKETKITFWWESVPDATSYVFQLVKPTFSAVELLIEDTETENTQLELNLSAGHYQWRVKAKNKNSETTYSVANFVISE